MKVPGLRIFKLLIAINFTISQYSFAQTGIVSLHEAYKQNHAALLEKNLLSHAVKGIEKYTDTSKNLNALINSFLFYYTQETRHGSSNDFQQDLGKEVYIALQPKILVCFANVCYLKICILFSFLRQLYCFAPIIFHPASYKIIAIRIKGFR